MYLVWNSVNGHLLQALSLPGDGTFDFSPDGNLVFAQALNGRVTVENWALRTRFRLPFISYGQELVGPTDPPLLQAYEDQAIQTLGFFQYNLGRYIMAGKSNVSPQLGRRG